MIDRAYMLSCALHPLARCVEDGAVDEEEGGSGLNGKGRALLLGVANDDLVGAELAFSARDWRGAVNGWITLNSFFAKSAPMLCPLSLQNQDTKSLALLSRKIGRRPLGGGDFGRVSGFVAAAFRLAG